MPSLRLIQPLDTDPPIPDEYGFREGFRNTGVADLIAAYNSGIGCRGWVSARGHYLIALREALLATGLDCSGFISAGGMNMDFPVKLKGRKIVPVRTA